MAEGTPSYLTHPHHLGQPISPCSSQAFCPWLPSGHLASYPPGSMVSLFQSPFLVLLPRPDVMVKPQGSVLGTLLLTHRLGVLVRSHGFTTCPLCAHKLPNLYSGLSPLNSTACSEHCLLRICTWMSKRWV